MHITLSTIPSNSNLYILLKHILVYILILIILILIIDTVKVLTSTNKTVYWNTYLRNFWKAKSVSCIGSQAGSHKNCFFTSVSRLRLVGGSPWGSCGGKDKIRFLYNTLIADIFPIITVKYLL